VLAIPERENSGSRLFGSTTLPPHNYQAARSGKELLDELGRAVRKDCRNDYRQYPAWLKMAEQLRKFREHVTVHAREVLCAR
jgi:hypothetical protein